MDKINFQKVTTQEFEIWSAPGNILDVDIGKEYLEKKITRDLFLSREVAIGVSHIPGGSDTDNLAIAIEEGELVLSDFIRFCYRNKLNPDPIDNISACSFLEYSYGRPLMWIHIPDSESSKMLLEKIAKWARGNGFCLVEPNQCFCFA